MQPLDGTMENTTETAQLPLLDARLFRSGTPSERKEFAISLRDSLCQHGFARVINHGISASIVDEMFEWSRNFFELPQDVKREIEHQPGPNPQRGWSAVGAESTAKLFGDLVPGGGKIIEKDAKEHFDQGPTDDLMFPNQWPSEEEIPGLRSFLERFYNLSHCVGLGLLEALEVGLDLPTGSFTQQCQQHADELRLIHYPELRLSDDKPQAAANRVWPHTDLGVITCLFQDEVGGLEMEDRACPGRFLAIPPGQRRDEMVVNISETMERWSNGVLKAGKHLVRTPQSQKTPAGDIKIPERYSSPFFVKASRETCVGPLPYFVSQELPPAYSDMTALEFHMKRVAKSY